MLSIDVVDALETEHRVLYWERNELQLILPDAGDQYYIESLIRKLNEREEQIVQLLGYLPAA